MSASRPPRLRLAEETSESGETGGERGEGGGRGEGRSGQGREGGDCRRQGRVEEKGGAQGVNQEGPEAAGTDKPEGFGVWGAGHGCKGEGGGDGEEGRRREEQREKEEGAEDTGRESG